MLRPPAPRSPHVSRIARSPGDGRAARAARSPRRPFLAAAAAAVVSLARAPAARAAPARGGGPGARWPGRASAGAPGWLTEGALAGVEAYVAGALERFGVPGAAVAVVQGGALRLARGFGVTELGGGGRPVGPDTRFIIGSMPKSMTALLVGTLVDEGRLGRVGHPRGGGPPAVRPGRPRRDGRGHLPRPAQHAQRPAPLRRPPLLRPPDPGAGGRVPGRRAPARPARRGLRLHQPGVRHRRLRRGGRRRGAVRARPLPPPTPG